MPFRLSRRRCVLFMGSMPLLARATAQAPPTPPSVPAVPAQSSDKAAADVREVSDKLAAIEVSMNIEPSFRFMA